MVAMEPDYEDHLIGTVVADKFRLRDRVGVGSSGTVYRADQIALGRTVAVKILDPALAADPRLVKRFHDEALAASRLNHPNTVSIIDYGQTSEGLLYLVMELVGGETLTQLIRRESPLPAARIIDITGQILAGLEEAHEAGVVHADLKSDNIVVERRRGGWDLIKVVDFGIARIIGAPRQEQGERTICGTPEYMAPEVIGGAEPSFVSDLYAVGVMAYEMMVGHTPFVGGSAVDVLTRHLWNEPVRPSLRDDAARGAAPSPGEAEATGDLEASRALEDVVMRALAKKASARYPDARTFREALASAAPRSDAAGEGTRCDACDTTSPVAFKFCPECGAPQVLTLSAIADDAARAPTAEVPLEVLEALDLLPEAGPFPLPLIGRDHELETLVQFFLHDGAPTMMQVVGEPGSGRSRLVREAYARMAEVSRDVGIYQANADPSGVASSYYPIRAVVAAILGLPPLCSYEGLGDALEGVGLSRRDLPGIAELFGQQAELWQLEPPVRRRELLAATIRVLRAAADRAPAVLVFEDVDRYDHPSQELLRRLAERVDDHPLRVVLSCGNELSERWPGHVPRVVLGPLDEAALGDLDRLTASSGSASPADAAALARASGGSPARAHHLLRYYLETGSIEESPDSIADLVATRLGHLPRPALLLCQAAAVLGSEAPRAVLERVLRDLQYLEAGAFEPALAVARARGLVEDDREVVAFEQLLVRDVVYDATPADVRRALHAAAAEVLQQVGGDPAVLGHHHDMAGNRGEAAALLMRAGDDAVHQLDDLGACAHYQRALSASRACMLADGEEGGKHRLQFVTLSVKLADVLRIGGEAALARGVVEEARGYCAGAAALEAQLLRASAHLSLTEGETEVAIRSVRRAVGLAIPSGQLELVADLYLDLSSMHLRHGEAPAALAELEEAVDLLTLGGGARANDGPQSMWRLLLRIAQLRASLEQSADAVTYGQAALRHARRVRSRLGVARAQSMLASLLEARGEADEAQRHRQAAVDEMRRMGDRRGTAELLLAGMSPTRTIMRISPASLHEAVQLADEVGWTEGVERARRTLG